MARGRATGTGRPNRLDTTASSYHIKHAIRSTNKFPSRAVNNKRRTSLLLSQCCPLVVGDVRSV